MKKIMRLALITEDREYAAAFTEAVAATQACFAVSVVSGPARPEVGDDRICIVDTARDELEITVAGAAGPVIIGKYAGCSRICAESGAAWAAAHGVVGFARGARAPGALHLISFVGVDGGAGASSLALGLAAELSAYRGKKALYLSFETVESPFLGRGARSAARGDMAGFLFSFLKQEKNGSGAGVSAALYTECDDYGVVRFPPSAGLNRLRELDAAELARFMAAVTDELAPDVVIADWGCGVYDAAAAYVGGAAFTVFVARCDGGKVAKGDDAALLALADELGVDRSRAIAVFSRAPVAGDADESGEAGESQGDGAADATIIEVCEDPYAFDRDGARVSLSLATSFGTGVKRLADIVLGADATAVADGDERAAAPGGIDGLFTEAA
jgi:MinD-like ATPase involved in chromosome partitioning or flagellar assembly